MKKMTFEKAYRELQDILAKLQDEAVSIDDLGDKTKRAGELIEYCRKILRNTEEELGEVLGTEGDK